MAFDLEAIGTVIEKKKFVPIGTVLLIVYGATQYTHLGDQVNAQAEDIKAQASEISDLKQNQLKHAEIVSRIDRKLALIQGRMGIKDANDDAE